MKTSRSQIRRTLSSFLVLSVVAGACLANAMTAAGHDIAGLKQLYTGDVVQNREQLGAYVGRHAVERIVGTLRQRAYLLNYEQLGINYGENVEYQLRREQVILCPQTAAFLYSQFTPATVSYAPGSRPVLEKVVADATGGCTTSQDKVLGLMRFCRDLYQRDRVNDDSKYIYGGTEEQLIEKGERLCECLGRLFVALCEVAGFPARIVMHDIGGHITAETYVDGHWGYIDPRCGVYFLKPDGALASVWELWQDPRLMRGQSEEVKADVGEQWTYEERLFKCEKKYFHPEEVNGFQNYRLRDADRYSYNQLTQDEAKRSGLFVINGFYREAANRIFGMEDELDRYIWPERELKKIPLAYRNDGFSQWFRKPPMPRSIVEERLIDPFEGTNVETLVWGVGPGSVFCYDTKVGEVFGAPLTDEQWKLMRQGDRWVYENVTSLIEAGHCPMRIAAERGHEIGLKVMARLEMNHEYGPADLNNWMWVGFVGRLNKEHPEYRIGKSVRLDFKHKEVRDFKIAILRETAEAGVDGVSLDYAVYPPHFAEPDCAIMTQFVRDVRAMLDDVGRKQGRRLDIMVRVPFRDALGLGLDWRTWMEEKLVDTVVVTHLRPTDAFDIPVEDFIRLGKGTGCKVYGCTWLALGFVTTDSQPSDDGKKRRRYDKPKTKEMYYSQALLFHRAGVDGIQTAMSADAWLHRPWLNDLADPAKIEFADKHYMADPRPYLPVKFAAPMSARDVCDRLILMRVADDIPKARAAGHDVDATLVFYSRALRPGEKLEVFINTEGPLLIDGASPNERTRAGEALVDLRKQKRDEFIFDRQWWKRGERKISIDANWLKLGTNTIRFVYSAQDPETAEELSISWVDLLLKYRRAGTARTSSGQG